jgi:glycosyltransferase involved in cell wall biosynthesis
LGKQLVFEINGLANEEQRLKGNSFFIRFFALLINMTERIAVRCSNQIISVTPQIASYLKVHFNCSQKRIKVVNNGVNTKIFRPIYDEDFLEIWKNKLGITREDKVIGFVGNLALWQGVHILIESASHILSKKIKLKVLIIGDGPLKKSLMKKAFDSGFYKNFIFTGMVDYEAVPIFINIADIGVAPFISRRNIETGVSPLKVFEYMACGKPVVASRIEGLEFVETDGAGWLIEPENKKQLEEALFDLIMDNQKRIHMGSKGLQIAHNKLAWDSRVIHIEKILKELA